MRKAKWIHSKWKHIINVKFQLIVKRISETVHSRQADRSRENLKKKNTKKSMTINAVELSSTGAFILVITNLY